MVTIVHIDRWGVTEILIYNGNQAKIHFLATFDKMGFDQEQLREPSKPLYGFSGKRINRSKPSHSQSPSVELKGFVPVHRNVHFLREQPEQNEIQPSAEFRKVIEVKGEF
jgi:hypothetical protein